MKRATVMCLALTLSFAASGYERTSEVLAACGANPADGLNQAFASMHCSGYLTGVIDGVLMLQAANPEKPKYICVPGYVSGQQTLQAVTSWLRGRPELARESARVTVLRALSATYPC